MKKRQMVITWIITCIVLIGLGWYAGIMLWGASADDSVPAVVRWALIIVAVLVLLPLMVMMIVTARRRNREIVEEDENDLGKY